MTFGRLWRRCYFLLAQKVTKDALGDAFGAHPACGGAHRRLAPKPPFYERGPLRLGSSFRRAKSRSVSVLFSAHWGLMPSKFAGRYLLSHTAWCVPTCLVRRWSYKGAQQLPSCHGYARAGGEISTQNAANFGLGRPQWAEARRTQGLVFGGRRTQVPIFQDGVPP